MSFIRKVQIPLIYFAAGLLWITWSDDVLFHLAGEMGIDPKTLMFWGSMKGYLYVLLTSILLYFLIKNRTKALEASRADFRRIFKDSPNPMWIYDLESYRFILVNEAALRQYGYTREEFETLTILDIRPEKAKKRLQEYIKSGKIDSYNRSGDWIHRSKSGNEFYVRITSHETTYNGNVCRLVTAMDIHDKVIAEMERRNVQKALNNAALVCMCDVEGQIVTINEQIQTRLGYAISEMVGRSCTDFHIQEKESIVWEKVWELIRAGKTWRSDVALLDKLENTVWLDMVITPVENHEGEIYKFICIGYEISERKSLEAHQKILLEDLAEYAFQTSHELRAPLSRMLALISIIDDESEREFVLNSLKSTSHEMDHIIRKMNQALSRSSQAYILSKKGNNGNS